MINNVVCSYQHTYPWHTTISNPYADTIENGSGAYKRDVLWQQVGSSGKCQWSLISQDFCIVVTYIQSPGNIVVFAITKGSILYIRWLSYVPRWFGQLLRSKVIQYQSVVAEKREFLDTRDISPTAYQIIMRFTEWTVSINLYNYRVKDVLWLILRNLTARWQPAYGFQVRIIVQARPKAYSHRPWSIEGRVRTCENTHTPGVGIVHTTWAMCRL